MEEIEIPQYFLCPISLQMMKDPVTTITGITYDRESIEKWLNTSDKEEAAAAASTTTTTTCPFTKLPLPKDSDLTPNHMVRHLIQAWCTTNARYGIDCIPTPKSPLSKTHVRKLVRNLNVVKLFKSSLMKMDELANESEKSRRCLMENGVVKAMVYWVIRLFKEKKMDGLDDILRILCFVWGPFEENEEVLKDNYDLIQSLTWVLTIDEIDNQEKVKACALRIMNIVLELSSSKLMEKLKNDFFIQMVKIIHQFPSNQSVIKSGLNILIQVCQSRKRVEIIETGIISEIIELELGNKDKKISELNMCLLAHLCGCADGRAQLLNHAGAIAVVTKRILKISACADDQAVHILALICRFSATQQVLMEMLTVGAVSKLFMVIQADCGHVLKKKASQVLRLHSNVWSTSPCIQLYFLTMQR